MGSTLLVCRTLLATPAPWHTHNLVALQWLLRRLSTPLLLSLSSSAALASILCICFSGSLFSLLPIQYPITTASAKCVTRSTSDHLALILTSLSISKVLGSSCIPPATKPNVYRNPAAGLRFYSTPSSSCLVVSLPLAHRPRIAFHHSTTGSLIIRHANVARIWMTRSLRLSHIIRTQRPPDSIALPLPHSNARLSRCLLPTCLQVLRLVALCRCPCKCLKPCRIQERATNTIA